MVRERFGGIKLGEGIQRSSLDHVNGDLVGRRRLPVGLVDASRSGGGES